MNTTRDAFDAAKIVAFLSNPASYANGTNSVRVVETHISWVFLTAQHAYKLKKPVRFEFLDFSEPELRHQACEEELRLNRRLAPDVYIAVLPVTRGANRSLALDGRGTEIDWVVQMRRLPADRALDAVLRHGQLKREDAGEIARYLVDFYTRLSPQPIAADGYRQALERHIRANGATLLDAHSAERTRLRGIQSAQLRYLSIQADLIGSRAADGRVVDGHGDLRPEHIYVTAPPAVIDCLEFSRELRTVDIADELSFLAMECERLGDGGLGELVLATYQDRCGDRIPRALLAFYRAYRACVRAKVVLLRRQQQAENEQSSDNLFRQYIELADSSALELGPASLVVVSGMMGTGKSTLAKELADAWGDELLSTDHIRRSMLGASQSPAGYAEGHYEPELRRRVYDELLRRASQLLSDRQSLILDGTFLTRELREQARDLGRRYGAACLYVQCACPRSTAIDRVHGRSETGRSESEARTELYDLQARDFELPRADERAVTVDTTQAMRQQLETVCNELRRRLRE